MASSTKNSTSGWKEALVQNMSHQDPCQRAYSEVWCAWKELLPSVRLIFSEVLLQDLMSLFVLLAET